MAKAKPSPSPQKSAHKIQDWNNPEGWLKIEAWARDGLDKQQIANNCGVGIASLISWEKKYPEIAQALKRGREIADIEVENALFKTACGYEYEEVTEERKLNPETGKFEMVVTKKVRKQVQPSNTAQIFWLKNRRPDTWRDRREIDNSDALERLDQILGQVRENAESAGPKIKNNNPEQPAGA